MYEKPCRRQCRCTGCSLYFNKSIDLYFYQGKPIVIKPEKKEQKATKRRTTRPNYLKSLNGLHNVLNCLLIWLIFFTLSKSILACQRAMPSLTELSQWATTYAGRTSVANNARPPRCSVWLRHCSGPGRSSVHMSPVATLHCFSCWHAGFTASTAFYWG